MWNDSDYQIEVTLVRHGATPGNLEKRYIGSTDEELTPETEETIKGLNYDKPELVFSSPMLRATRTAELLWKPEKILLIDNLKEMDFGLYEGKNYMELADDPYYQKWIDSNGTLPFPQGESRGEFIIRSMRGFAEMINIARERNAHKIGAVVHGGTIMAIMSSIFNGDYYDYQVKNAEGYVITIPQGDVENEVSYNSLSSGLYT